MAARRVPRNSTSSRERITSESPRILIVEDEVAIATGLRDALDHQGYAAEVIARGDEAIATVEDRRFDLVILDIMLPGASGFDVCEALRRQDEAVPVLMLTARGSEDDILRAFETGCDDYVTKPFSVAELHARVAALLRRARPPATSTFEFGPWSIDPEALTASRGGESLAVSRREAGLLACLIREPGRIVSRRALLRELWGLPAPDRIETRTVDMHIAKLRKKLGKEGGDLIETVRGEGYRFKVAT